MDDRKIARIFVNRRSEVDAQKPSDPAVRRSYFDFVCSLMLRDLLRSMSPNAGPLHSVADTARPELVWPEGFACTLFCLHVLAALIEQESDDDTTLAPEFSACATGGPSAKTRATMQAPPSASSMSLKAIIPTGRCPTASSTA